MIADKDRSGYFGASDTDKIVGNWKTATFEKWWMQKLGINRDSFNNRYTAAGTHFEHKILESLGIPMELDKQIILEDLKLRVNLDGNTEDCIYECKTYRFDKGFKMPRKYINQVQVQMFAFGIHKAKIVVYGLKEEDYDNYFNPIDPERRDEVLLTYDEKWINEVYLPRITYLAQCLKEGRFPCA
jgi:hypothetical protein